LLPSPWGLVIGGIREGDVVTGRVQSIRDFGAVVEILPRVAGLVHISEVDWTYVQDISEFVKPGDVVAVKVIEVDREREKLALSIKQALRARPAPLPSLVPGGVPFTWPIGADAAEPAPEPTADLSDHVRSLKEELEAAEADRRA